MKKIFILPTFISLAMICSCQKQDSAAEQELAQRKTELDARENALDERMNALDDRVKALDATVKILAENQKAMANAETSLYRRSGRTPDPAQAQAERERIQQLSTEMRARIADPSRLNSARAEKEKRTQERLAQRQRALDGSQTQKQLKSNMFSGADISCAGSFIFYGRNYGAASIACDRGRFANSIAHTAVSRRRDLRASAETGWRIFKVPPKLTMTGDRLLFEVRC